MSTVTDGRDLIRRLHAVLDVDVVRDPVLRAMAPMLRRAPLAFRRPDLVRPLAEALIAFDDQLEPYVNPSVVLAHQCERERDAEHAQLYSTIALLVATLCTIARMTGTTLQVLADRVELLDTPPTRELQ